jgi:hypothetical protein
MYRIELEPGDVGVFRSVEEIATAIKSGVITARARIYHQATDKWLPIEFHPHYKQALELVAGGIAAAGSTSGPAKVFTTPSGPRPAIQVATAPPPVTPKQEPPVEKHEPAVEWKHEPAVESKAEPGVEPPHEPAARLTHEPVPAPEPAHEPAASVAHDGYQPIADRVSGPLHRHASAPEPELEPEPDVEPASEFEPEPEAESELERAPFIEVVALDPPAEPALADAHAGFPAAEPRPVFRPRLRIRIAGKPRRSFLVALGGMVLVCTTQLGLTTPERFGLDVRSLGLFQPQPAPAVVPHPSTAGAPAPASTPPPAPAKPAAAPPAPTPAPSRAAPAPATQISPSFGSSSAFTQAAPAQPMPAGQARREPPAPARAEVKDSIVGAAPAPTDIAIGAPVIPVVTRPAAPAPSGRLTAAALATRYQAAYAAARADLETGLRTAGFANLFATERLTSPEGVRAARLSAGTASAYVAKYRRREGEIEQAYADSFATLSKQLAWSADERRAWDNHQVLQEKPEVAKLAGFLLTEIDSVYGVLSSQEGAYEIKGGTITFQDAKAAHAYAELKPWLDRRAHQWADTGSGTPTTAARVLRAIGTTKLPDGGAL